MNSLFSPASILYCAWRISIDLYNSLLETSYLLSSEANARHLTDSVRNAGSGAATERELVEG